MRKYVIGAVFGFMLAFAFGANANSIQTVVGQVVQGTFPVTIEGKQLQKDAIVVDNSTYLPVRVFGEATGYDVNFSSEKGVTMTIAKRALRDIESKKETLAAFEQALKDLERNKDGYITAYGEEAYNAAFVMRKEQIQTVKDEIAKLEAKLQQ